MATVTQPTLIPRPWAENGSKETIPDTTTQFGRASWSEGFPSETAQPLAAGGIPPNWLDFQGVLYALSQHATFEQVGGRYTWSNAQNYPAGACVLGSNGMVYQALQESGPGTSAGAKNPTSSGNAAYWGPSATPDGTTIIVQNGKLTAVASGDADSLADGITTVANNGKLTVDFSNVTAAALKKITQHEIDPEGGIVMDSSTGLLSVDFEAMPDERVERLFKSLSMLIPLSSDKTFYVDTNNPAASDIIVDDRGTEAKPFKTIQACVNYVTGTYSLGQYNCVIRVKAGNYGENLVLPDFSHGTGHMTIAADSRQPDVFVIAQASSAGTVGTCFRATGGDWRLYYLTAKRVENATTANGQVPCCYFADAGAILHLYGCSVDQSLPTPGTSVGGNSYEVRLFAADNGGTIHFHHWINTVAATIKAEKPASGVPTVYVLTALRRGSIWLYRDYDSSNNPVTTGVINCSGSCDAFVRLRDTGSITSYSSGTLITFSGSSVSGVPYNLTGGSYISIDAGTGYFPGDGTPNVEAATYCWIK